MPHLKQNTGSLFDSDGQRKYLTRQERDLVLETAKHHPKEVRALISLLAYSGCRISEAIELTCDRVDLKEGVVVFKTLKTGDTKAKYRAIPLPPHVVDLLDLVFNVRQEQAKKTKGRGVALWKCSRTTAWRYVKAVLEEAGVLGIAATPKGFRHSFGVIAVSEGIPLNMVQKWLGHSQLSTTAIYADAMGEEEKSIASKIW